LQHISLYLALSGICAVNNWAHFFADFGEVPSK
jgi:hypothetical protein